MAEKEYQGIVTVEFRAEDDEDAQWIFEEEVEGRIGLTIVHTQVEPLFEEQYE